MEHISKTAGEVAARLSGKCGGLPSPAAPASETSSTGPNDDPFHPLTRLVWTAFTELFRANWTGKRTRAHPDGENAQPNSMWDRNVRRFSLPAVKRAIDAVERSGADFPPSCPRFRRLLEEAAAALAREEADRHRQPSLPPSAAERAERVRMASRRMSEAYRRIRATGPCRHCGEPLIDHHLQGRAAKCRTGELYFSPVIERAAPSKPPAPERVDCFCPHDGTACVHRCEANGTDCARALVGERVTRPSHGFPIEGRRTPVRSQELAA